MCKRLFKNFNLNLYRPYQHIPNSIMTAYQGKVQIEKNCGKSLSVVNNLNISFIDNMLVVLLKRQAILIGKGWTPGIWLGGLFPSIINFVPEGRCQSAHFLSQFPMPFWLSGRQRDVFLGGEMKLAILKKYYATLSFLNWQLFTVQFPWEKEKNFHFHLPLLPWQRKTFTCAWMPEGSRNVKLCHSVF